MILAGGIELAKNKSAGKARHMAINKRYEWSSVVCSESGSLASSRTGADYFLVALQ